MNVVIRNEHPEDRQAIFQVHASAFPTDSEAQIVDALRRNELLSVSLVAVLDEEIVGHIAFSPVTLNHRERDGLGLAPVAVLPDHQRKGIGSQLIEEGVRRCRDLQTRFVVVLGDPSYYPRFGFRRAKDWNLDNEYGADGAFMAQELIENCIPEEGGLIRYADVFASEDKK